MPTSHAALVSRLERLIEKGRAVLVVQSSEGYVDAGKTVGFQTQALVCLSDLVGEDHPYYREFQSTIQTDSMWHNARRVEQLVAILESVIEDLRSGHLAGIVNLISADVFGDFLEMAEHLLENGYKDPAASLIGAVLEDGLRRIATSAGLTVKPGDNLTALNSRCAAKGVYSNLVQRSVAVWIAVRNKADHGEFAEYTDHDVESMLAGVRHLLGDRLS